MSAQITSLGFKNNSSLKKIQMLRDEFNKQHFVRLRQFIEPSLLKRLHSMIARAEFYRKADGKIAVEACMRQNVAYNILQFLTNDPLLFKFVESFTGCPSVGCYDGRVYRMDPGNEHYDSWHDDLNPKNTRLVAMSINLSEHKFQGGSLQIRQKNSKKIIQEVFNTGFGDAVFFRIAPFLQHRVNAMLGNQSRVAFAGWFLAKKHSFSFLGRRKQKINPGVFVKPTNYFSVPQEIVSRADQNTTLLLNAKSGACHKLAGVANPLWNKIVQGYSASQLINFVTKHYEVGSQKAQKDIHHFTQELSSQGFLESKSSHNL